MLDLDEAMSSSPIDSYSRSDSKEFSYTYRSTWVYRLDLLGFDVYVGEDKSVLGDERLLELTQRLAQKPHLIVS